MSIAERDLVKARNIAARVVNQFGDRYWPIFEMLDQEIATRRAREERIQSCLNRDSTFYVQISSHSRTKVTDDENESSNHSL